MRRPVAVLAACIAGTTRLRLGYVRSGPTDPPAQSYVLTLAVRR